jgi:hypothetical protein
MHKINTISMLIITMIIIGGCNSTLNIIDEFQEFELAMYDDYDYIDDLQLEITRHASVLLQIKTNRLLTWDESKALFLNDISLIMRSEKLLDKIRERYGPDPLKSFYPNLFVNIQYYDNELDKYYTIQFESSYYNTPIMSALTEKNLEKYNNWSIFMSDEFPDTPVEELSISFEE